MSVSARKQAERDVLRCAQLAESALLHALARLERDIQAVRYDTRPAVIGGHAGTLRVLRTTKNEAVTVNTATPASQAGTMTLDAIDLGALLKTIENLRALVKQPVDADHAAVSDDASYTSRVAARKALPKSGSLRRVIYTQVSARAHGMTDKELERLLGRSHESISSARNSLVEAGWLYDSGMRRALDGSLGIIWLANPEEPQ